MATPGSSRSPEGISLRHARHCQSGAGDPCTCRPSYQAQVFSPADRKTFRTLADARAWRAQAKTELDRGTLRAPTRTTLGEAGEEWLKAAEAGVVRMRSGDRYKPSAIRGYEEALTHETAASAGAQAAFCNSELVRPGPGRPARRRGKERLDGPQRRPSAAGDLPARYRALRVFANPTLGLALPASGDAATGSPAPPRQKRF